MMDFPRVEQLLALNPVVICAPTIRCGSTLLQRLLCSADNALIYGESLGNYTDQLLQLYAFKALVYSKDKTPRDELLQKILNREINEWIPDLLPPVDNYLNAFGEGCFTFLQYSATYAREQGKTVWGFKVTGWNMVSIGLLRHLMPQVKTLFIYRDIADCLRSAKAIEMINNTEDCRIFCQNWLSNTKDVLSQQGNPDFLFLRYETIVDQPDKTIQQLENFTKAVNIDKRVLDKRINTIVRGDQRDLSGAGHIPPAELSEEELEILQEVTNEFRKTLYNHTPIG